MNNASWIDAYCLDKKGVEKVWQTEWEAMKYLLHGKMFAYMGEHKNGDPIITMKLPPEEGQVLRAAYPDAVIPGYYMNKVHWNTLYLRGSPAELSQKSTARNHRSLKKGEAAAFCRSLSFLISKTIHLTYRVSSTGLNRWMVPVSFRWHSSESTIGKPKSPTTPKSCSPTNILANVITG